MSEASLVWTIVVILMILAALIAPRPLRALLINLILTILTLGAWGKALGDRNAARAVRRDLGKGERMYHYPHHRPGTHTIPGTPANTFKPQRGEKE